MIKNLLLLVLLLLNAGGEPFLELIPLYQKDSYFKEKVYREHDHKSFEQMKAVNAIVSALIRKDGKIYRTSYDLFGPGDYYCATWHLFDLFPKGANDWQPKYNYEQAIGQR